MTRVTVPELKKYQITVNQLNNIILGLWIRGCAFKSTATVK